MSWVDDYCMLYDYSCYCFCCFYLFFYYISSSSPWTSHKLKKIARKETLIIMFESRGGCQRLKQVMPQTLTQNFDHYSRTVQKSHRSPPSLKMLFGGTITTKKTNWKRSQEYHGIQRGWYFLYSVSVTVFLIHSPIFYFFLSLSHTYYQIKSILLTLAYGLVCTLIWAEVSLITGS